MSLRSLLGAVLVLAVALGGNSTASAQKDKDKTKDKKPPTLADVQGVTRVAYSPDGSFIVMDYRTGSPTRPDSTSALLGIWDAKTGESRLGLDKPPRTCERIAISPDGKKVVAISVGDKQLKVWDSATGKVLDDQKLPAWSGSIMNSQLLKFAADGALYGIRDKQIFEVPAGGKFRLLDGQLDVSSPEEMTFDPVGKRLILINNMLGRPAGEIRVYDAAKGGAPEKTATTGHIRAVALSGDGKTLALSYQSSGGKTRLEFWDTAGWKLRTTAPADARKDFVQYSTLAFAPDGKTLAGVPVFTKGGDTLLDILDADGKLVREVKKKEKFYAFALAFSPDGKTLAVILSSHSLLFIDPATGEPKKP